MKTQFTVITCAKSKKLFGTAPRHYGYTLAINPSKTVVVDGEDIEGIGWVPHIPHVLIQKWQGWYKYKSDAAHRADVLNKSA